MAPATITEGRAMAVYGSGCFDVHSRPERLLLAPADDGRVTRSVVDLPGAFAREIPRLESSTTFHIHSGWRSTRQ